MIKSCFASYSDLYYKCLFPSKVNYGGVTAHDELILVGEQMGKKRSE